jgi:hypothetical protein
VLTSSEAAKAEAARAWCVINPRAGEQQLRKLELSMREFIQFQGEEYIENILQFLARDRLKTAVNKLKEAQTFSPEQIGLVSKVESIAKAKGIASPNADLHDLSSRAKAGSGSMQFAHITIEPE